MNTKEAPLRGASILMFLQRAWHGCSLMLMQQMYSQQTADDDVMCAREKHVVSAKA